MSNYRSDIPSGDPQTFSLHEHAQESNPGKLLGRAMITITLVESFSHSNNEEKSMY
jgi:hypothetical protein